MYNFKQLWSHNIQFPNMLKIHNSCISEHDWTNVIIQLDLFSSRLKRGYLSNKRDLLTPVPKMSGVKAIIKWCSILWHNVNTNISFLTPISLFFMLYGEDHLSFNTEQKFWLLSIGHKPFNKSLGKGISSHGFGLDLVAYSEPIFVDIGYSYPPLPLRVQTMTTASAF